MTSRAPSPCSNTSIWRDVRLQGHVRPSPTGGSATRPLRFIALAYLGRGLSFVGRRPIPAPARRAETGSINFRRQPCQDRTSTLYPRVIVGPLRRKVAMADRDGHLSSEFEGLVECAASEPVLRCL